MEYDQARLPQYSPLRGAQKDETEDEGYWLEGMKVFEETDPGTDKASLRSHPVQGFKWSDFTAKPGHKYKYRVVALKSHPSQLNEDDSIEIRIATETEDTGVHEVWFNRGAAASQEYARRFKNKPPDVVGKPAFDWLSRGLFEAMLAFISRANSSHFGLRVAAYQFSYPEVLNALQDASDAQADVRIIYDAREPNLAATNRDAVRTAEIKTLCTERTACYERSRLETFPVSVLRPCWTDKRGTVLLKPRRRRLFASKEPGRFRNAEPGHRVADSGEAKYDTWNCRLTWETLPRNGRT